MWAISLQEKQNELFQDEKGGYFLVSKGDKNLLLRLKEGIKVNFHYNLYKKKC